MTISLVSCCAFTVFVFFVMFVRRQDTSIQSSNTDLDQADWSDTRLLLERFLLTVLAVLLLIVLSGHAVEFKNRWFQPLICLFPGYLALTFAPYVLRRPRAMNVSVVTTLALMLVILIAVVARPVTGGYRGKYSWLNVPYGDAAKLIRDQSERPPEIIVTANARIAGNMKVQYPDATVISCDAQHLTDGVTKRDPSTPLRILAFADSESADSMIELAAFAEKVFNARLNVSAGCQAIDVGYVYGATGDTRHFLYSEWDLESNDQLKPQVEAAVASRHLEGEYAR